MRRSLYMIVLFFGFVSWFHSCTSIEERSRPSLPPSQGDAAEKEESRFSLRTDGWLYNFLGDEFYDSLRYIDYANAKDYDAEKRLLWSNENYELLGGLSLGSPVFMDEFRIVERASKKVYRFPQDMNVDGISDEDISHIREQEGIDLSDPIPKYLATAYVVQTLPENAEMDFDGDAVGDILIGFQTSETSDHMGYYLISGKTPADSNGRLKLIAFHLGRTNWQSRVEGRIPSGYRIAEGRSFAIYPVDLYGDGMYAIQLAAVISSQTESNGILLVDWRYDADSKRWRMGGVQVALNAIRVN